MAVTAVETPPQSGARRRSTFAQVLGNLRRSRGAMIGLGILVVHVGCATLAPLIAPYSPTDIDPAHALQGPTWAHPFGTDEFGRDVLSRVIYGGRLALAVAVSATLIAVVAGGAIGLTLGYVRGWIEEVGSRILDAVLAVPGILILLVIVTALGTGPWVILFAMAVHYAPGSARIVRAAAMEVMPQDFVTAARARGERGASIVLREVQPNVRDVLFVEFAIRASWAVLLISALSFLGFGANPPTADWGLMIAEGQSTLSIAAWITLFPILALSTLVIGLNLAADGLAKALGVDLTRGAAA